MPSKDKDKIREQQRRWAQKPENKAKIKQRTSTPEFKAKQSERFKKYREEHREELNNYSRNYHKEHRDELLPKMKEYGKIWYEENKDIKNKKSREKYEENPIPTSIRGKEYRSRPEVKEKYAERQREAMKIPEKRQRQSDLGRQYRKDAAETNIEKESLTLIINRTYKGETKHMGKFNIITETMNSSKRGAEDNPFEYTSKKVLEADFPAGGGDGDDEDNNRNRRNVPQRQEGPTQLTVQDNAVGLLGVSGDYDWEFRFIYVDLIWLVPAANRLGRPEQVEVRYSKEIQDTNEGKRIKKLMDLEFRAMGPGVTNPNAVLGVIKKFGLVEDGPTEQDIDADFSEEYIDGEDDGPKFLN